MTFFFASLFMLLVFWRPQEWLVPMLFGWPLLDVIVGLSLVSLMIEVNEGRVVIRREMPQIRLLLGLWLSAPISHLAHTYLEGMRTSIEPVFKICFFTMLLLVVMNRPARIRYASLLFVIVGMTMAFHAFLQMTRGYGFAYQQPLWVPPIDTEPGYYRAKFFGIFDDPNDLAQFLVTCMPLAFVLQRRVTFFSFAVGAGVCWYLYSAMVLTDSRGGMVGLMAVAGTQLLMFLPQRWFAKLFFAGLLAGLALCPFSGSLLDESAHERVVFWGMANAAFKHNLLFGIGYEMFWILTVKGEALHNAFVTCYTELGAFGYFFWFGLIQVGLVGAWRARVALTNSTDPDARWLRLLAGQTIVAMVGFCASAYFLSRTFIYPLFFLMAMLGAIPFIAERYLPPRHPPLLDYRKDVVKWGIIGTIISIIYVYISCILLNKAYYG